MYSLQAFEETQKKAKIQQRKSEKLNFFNYYIHREVVLKFGCILESTGDLLKISFLSQTIHQTNKITAFFKLLRLFQYADKFENHYQREMRKHHIHEIKAGGSLRRLLYKSGYSKAQWQNFKSKPCKLIMLSQFNLFIFSPCFCRIHFNISLFPNLFLRNAIF